MICQALHNAIFFKCHQHCGETQKLHEENSR